MVQSRRFRFFTFALQLMNLFGKYYSFIPYALMATLSWAGFLFLSVNLVLGRFFFLYGELF